MPTSAPAKSALRPSPATDGVTPNRARKAGMAGPYRAWSAPMTTNPPQHPAIAGMVSGPSRRIPTAFPSVAAPYQCAGPGPAGAQVAAPDGRESEWRDTQAEAGVEGSP